MSVNPDNPFENAIEEEESTIDEIEESIDGIDEIGPITPPAPAQPPAQPGQPSPSQPRPSQGAGEQQQNPIEAIEQSIEPDKWERLYFHHNVFAAIIATYIDSEQRTQEFKEEAYHANIGASMYKNKILKKGFKPTGTLKDALGEEFIESESNGQEDIETFKKVGKGVIDGGIEKLMNNNNYLNCMSEARGVINKESTKGMMKTFLRNAFTEEELGQMNPDEMYLNIVIALTPGLGGVKGKGAQVAGAVFGKYSVPNKVKEMMTKSLGGLIEQPAGGDQP